MMIRSASASVLAMLFAFGVVAKSSRQSRQGGKEIQYPCGETFLDEFNSNRAPLALVVVWQWKRRIALRG